jgi:hypothetical protein
VYLHMVSNPRRLESSVTLMWKPQIPNEKYFVYSLHYLISLVLCQIQFHIGLQWTEELVLLKIFDNRSSPISAGEWKYWHIPKVSEYISKVSVKVRNTFKLTFTAIFLLNSLTSYHTSPAYGPLRAVSFRDIRWKSAADLRNDNHCLEK